MNGDEQTSVDGRGQTNKWMLIDVGRNCDECRTKLQQISNGREGNIMEQQGRCITIRIRELYNNGVQKIKKICFEIKFSCVFKIEKKNVRYVRGQMMLVRCYFVIIIMVDTIYFASIWNSFKFPSGFGTVHHVFLQHLDFYSDHATLFPTQVWGGIHEIFILASFCALYI
jgi:hypothetical protein